MLITSFNLGLTYGLVAIFNPELEHPFNHWCDQHGTQGFTWRHESVAFLVLNSCTKLAVEIFLENEINLRADTVRAILVPFSVTSSKGIVVIDVTSESSSWTPLPMAAGEYALVFETGFQEQYRDDPKYQGRLVALLPTWCRLTFIPKACTQAEILRADSGFSPIYPLLMQAEPI